MKSKNAMSAGLVGNAGLDQKTLAWWHSSSTYGLASSPSTAYVLKILESLQYGGFLLDYDGRIVSLNISALACLGDGLALGGERLCATDQATDRRLRQTMDLVLEGAADPYGSLAVVVRRSVRLPLVLRLVRLDEKSQPASLGRLLLIAFDPEMKRVPSREVLRQAFDLTRAEADVAIGILSGNTLAEIAAARGVKVGTVRAHSKAVFLKTRTRGQADLTRLLGRLAFIAPEAVAGTAQSLDCSAPAPCLVASGNQS